MKIAIVGSGISGLSALWALNEHTDHEVHLFEKESRLGGHACTVPFQLPGKSPCQVDTAFLLINQRGWPNFFQCLQNLGVSVSPSSATLSVNAQGGKFEWSSATISSIFSSLRSVLDPVVWRMAFDIFRFNHFAIDLLRDKDNSEGLTVREYVLREGYSPAFRDFYLVPLAASIWSIPLDTVLNDMPMVTLVQSFHNQDLLRVFNPPQWYTISGGSHSYVQAIAASVAPEHVHLGEAVESVTPITGGIQLRMSDGSEEKFDHVILATHTYVTRGLLDRGGCMTPGLGTALSATKWTRLEIVIHGDSDLMPKNKRMWAAWNDHLPEAWGQSPGDLDSRHFTGSEGKIVVGQDDEVGKDFVSVTFDLNLMQNYPTTNHGHIFATLNPQVPIDPSLIISRHEHHQPILNNAHIASQALFTDDTWLRQHLPHGISIVGAWTGLGFHEDGFVSGLKAAQALGVPQLDWMVPRHHPLECAGVLSLEYWAKSVLALVSRFLS